MLREGNCTYRGIYKPREFRGSTVYEPDTMQSIRLSNHQIEIPIIARARGVGRTFYVIKQTRPFLGSRYRGATTIRTATALGRRLHTTPEHLGRDWGLFQEASFALFVKPHGSIVSSRSGTFNKCPRRWTRGIVPRLRARIDLPLPVYIRWRQK